MSAASFQRIIILGAISLVWNRGTRNGGDRNRPDSPLNFTQFYSDFILKTYNVTAWKTAIKVIALIALCAAPVWVNKGLFKISFWNFHWQCWTLVDKCWETLSLDVKATPTNTLKSSWPQTRKMSSESEPWIWSSLNFPWQPFASIDRKEALYFYNTTKLNERCPLNGLEYFNRPEDVWEEYKNWSLKSEEK